MGGQIGAWATIADTAKGLFNMFADLTRQAQTVDVPPGALVHLEAQVFSGYYFGDWRIEKTDGSFEYDYNPVFNRIAGPDFADIDYILAEFGVGSSPPPPPPPDTIPNCDDPSLPGCDPGHAPAYRPAGQQPLRTATVRNEWSVGRRN